MGHFSCLHGGDAEHRAQSPAHPWAHPRSQHHPAQGGFWGFAGVEAHLPRFNEPHTALARLPEQGAEFPFKPAAPQVLLLFSQHMGPRFSGRAGVQNRHIKRFFNSKFNRTHKKPPTKPCSKPPPNCSFHCALSYLPSIEKHMFTLCPELLQHLLTDL